MFTARLNHKGLEVAGCPSSRILSRITVTTFAGRVLCCRLQSASNISFASAVEKTSILLTLKPLWYFTVFCSMPVMAVKSRRTFRGISEGSQLRCWARAVGSKRSRASISSTTRVLAEANCKSSRNFSCSFSIVLADASENLTPGPSPIGMGRWDPSSSFIPKNSFNCRFQICSKSPTFFARGEIPAEWARTKQFSCCSSLTIMEKTALFPEPLSPVRASPQLALSSESKCCLSVSSSGLRPQKVVMLFSIKASSNAISCSCQFLGALSQVSAAWLLHSARMSV